MTPEETVAMMREQLGFLRTQIRVLEEQIRARDRQLEQLQIELPLGIVPHGWWITKDKDDSIFVYRYKPCIKDDWWLATYGDHYCLPPWIAANLPTEWHDLLWDQSAMQQMRGGDE